MFRATKKKSTYDNRSSGSTRASSHFWFRVGNRKFAYCYIRKNACSSFKRFICNISGASDITAYKQSAYSFMREFHSLATVEAIEECDEVILVYRDPYDRLVSTFVNKFVQRSGNKGIFQSYRNKTGNDPGQTSFRTFVTGYCSPPWPALDPHVRSQKHHLAPVLYTQAIAMADVHARMARLIGSQLADEHFARPVNATNYGTGPSASCDTLSEDLHRSFAATGQLPSRASLDDHELAAIVAERYRQDYLLIRGLSG